MHYSTRLDYILLQTLMFLFDSILVSLEFSDICRKYEVCTGYRYYSMESIRKRFLFICFDASKNSPVCFTQSVVFLTLQLMNKNFQALFIVWCFYFICTEIYTVKHKANYCGNTLFQSEIKLYNLSVNKYEIN